MLVLRYKIPKYFHQIYIYCIHEDIRDFHQRYLKECSNTSMSSCINQLIKKSLQKSQKTLIISKYATTYFCLSNNQSESLDASNIVWYFTVEQFFHTSFQVYSSKRGTSRIFQMTNKSNSNKGWKSKRNSNV